jgi:hypothetical protein
VKGGLDRGRKHLVLTKKEEAGVFGKKKKGVFEVTVSKNDFADLLELAEEDARKHKRIKKECDGVELVDILTID